MLGVPRLCPRRFTRLSSKREDCQKCRASPNSQASEIAVCTNKTCKRQGSQQVQHRIFFALSLLQLRSHTDTLQPDLLMSRPYVQILRVFEDLDLNEGVGISVRSTGCLGNCGSGPNLCLALDGKEHHLISVGTPAAAFKVLKEFCSHEVSEKVKMCIQVRLSTQSAKMSVQPSECSSETICDALI